MSTRAAIRIHDADTELWFYRHSDGNPSKIMPDLLKMQDWLKQEKIRNNTQQASGWLVRLGIAQLTQWQEEMLAQLSSTELLATGAADKKIELTQPPENLPYLLDWKAGFYEPATKETALLDYHWRFELDLVSMQLTASED